VIGASRGLRGGSWANSSGSGLASSNRSFLGPLSEQENVGFRVASVPEPAAVVLTIFAGGMMLIRRKR